MLILPSMQHSPVSKEISQRLEPRGFYTAGVWQVLKHHSQLCSMEISSSEVLPVPLRSRLCYLTPSGEPSCLVTCWHLTDFRYNPVQKYGPQDCIASINAIVKNIDHLVNTHNTAAITKLKAIFGLESLTDIRDFAMTVAFPSE